MSALITDSKPIPYREKLDRTSERTCTPGQHQDLLELRRQYTKIQRDLPGLKQLYANPEAGTLKNEASEKKLEDFQKSLDKFTSGFSSLMQKVVRCVHPSQGSAPAVRARH